MQSKSKKVAAPAAAPAKQSAPKAPPAPKQAAPNARNSSASFLNLCKQENIPSPTSAAGIAQFFADHQCNVILGESAAVAKERAAALSWVLPNYTNVEANRKLSPELDAILKTLYGKKVRYSKNSTTAFSIGSFYHSTIGSLPASDDEGSGADSAPAPVVDLAADPFALIRPTAPAPLTAPPAQIIPIQPPVQILYTPPTAAAAALAAPPVSKDIEHCSWPDSKRKPMDLTHTYSREEWKRSDHTTKDRPKPLNSAEQPAIFLPKHSESVVLPIAGTPECTPVRWGRALGRMALFYPAIPDSFADRSRYDEDLRQRVSLAAKLRAALTSPAQNSAESFWEVEQQVIHHVLEHMRMRANAIDTVVAEHGTPEIGVLARAQLEGLSKAITAQKTLSFLVAPNNEAIRRKRAFGAWDAYLNREMHFSDMAAADKELDAVIDGRPLRSRRTRRRSSSSSEDYAIDPPRKSLASGSRRLQFPDTAPPRRVVQHSGGASASSPIVLPPPLEPYPGAPPPVASSVAPISRDPAVYLPCSMGTCGDDTGSTFLATGPCRHPGCPVGFPDRPPFAYHIRSECPLRFAQLTGEAMPGFDRHGLMQPGDWVGERQTGFPIGPTLSPAAKLRWRTLIGRLNLVAHPHAPSGFNADSLVAPRGSGGARR